MTETPSYDPSNDLGKVRLLLNDVATPWVFTDQELQALLDLEDGSIKRAAAQAIDTNADNQALASKVLRSQDLSTDGAKVAQVMHQRATSLRQQADIDEERADDGFYFDVIDPIGDPYGLIGDYL